MFLGLVVRGVLQRSVLRPAVECRLCRKYRNKENVDTMLNYKQNVDNLISKFADDMEIGRIVF